MNSATAKPDPSNPPAFTRSDLRAAIEQTDSDLAADADYAPTAFGFKAHEILTDVLDTGVERLLIGDVLDAIERGTIGTCGHLARRRLLFVLGWQPDLVACSACAPDAFEAKIGDAHRLCDICAASAVGARVSAAVRGCVIAFWMACRRCQLWDLVHVPGARLAYGGAS